MQLLKVIRGACLLLVLLVIAGSACFAVFQGSVNFSGGGGHADASLLKALEAQKPAIPDTLAKGNP